MVIEDEFFEQVAGAGFDSIRLPVRWDTRAAATAPWTIDPAIFERVDDLVDLAVVRHGGALAAVAVDEVGDLVQRTSGTWHPVPAGADDLTTMGVTAIVDCGDRLVNVLDDLRL